MTNILYIILGSVTGMNNECADQIAHPKSGLEVNKHTRAQARTRHSEFTEHRGCPHQWMGGG